MSLYGKELSPRERQVIMITLTGCQRIETAKRLGLSPNTISTHILRAQRKLGARNPIHALMLFIRRELGPDAEPFYQKIESISKRAGG